MKKILGVRRQISTTMLFLNLHECVCVYGEGGTRSAAFNYNAVLDFQRFEPLELGPWQVAREGQKEGITRTDIFSTKIFSKIN